jgi:hypothetical protein
MMMMMMIEIRDRDRLKPQLSTQRFFFFLLRPACVLRPASRRYVRCSRPFGPLITGMSVNSTRTTDAPQAPLIG